MQYNESWRLMDQFVIKNLQASAFVVDATIKTRPLNPDVSVKTPAQISSLFDDIAYKKGKRAFYFIFSNKNKNNNCYLFHSFLQAVLFSGCYNNF